MNDLKVLVLLHVQSIQTACFLKFGNTFQVSFNELKLLTNRSTTFALPDVFLFDHFQVSLSGFPTIGACLHCLPRWGACRTSILSSSFSRASLSNDKSVVGDVRRGTGRISNNFPLLGEDSGNFGSVSVSFVVP